MKNVLLIAGKEIKSYFASPTAYLLMAAFGLIFGFLFAGSTRAFIRAGLQAQMMGQSQPMNVNDWIIGPLLNFSGTVTMFLIPFITMRLIAEEKKTGTIELLLTSPIHDNEIIIGKWLGAMALYLCILGMSALNVAFMFIWGKPDLAPVLVAYLGLILQGACLLAIGEFISTMTNNQIVAGGVTLLVILMLYLLNAFNQSDTSLVSQVTGYIAMQPHIENLAKGLLSLKDVVFYFSMTFLALFLTSRSMESLRWRS